jgi:hypothetical protein
MAEINLSEAAAALRGRLHDAHVCSAPLLAALAVFDACGGWLYLVFVPNASSRSSNCRLKQFCKRPAAERASAHFTPN